MNPDLKVTIWNILLGVLVALIIFLFLIRKSKRDESKKKTKSSFKWILIALISLAVLGVVYYFVMLAGQNSGGIKFPSTGPSPTMEVPTVGFSSLYATPADGIITFSLLISIFFLALAAFENIKRAREIDMAKTEFVSLASHQLRTPLTAINWYVEMLQSGDVGALNPNQKKYLGEIYKGGERMVKLVNNLLDVSRIETGRLRIELEMVDLASFVEDIIHEIEPLSSTLRREIVFNAPEISLPMIAIDRTLMRQVIHNIIINAVRYSPEDQTIRVVLEKKDEDYVISVLDEGIGIPLEAQERIFEKFFRADNAREVESEGSGIGMYISKTIAEESGGKLWFESPTLFKKVEGKEVGYGTTFHLSIPIRDMKSHKGKKRFS